MAGEPGLQLFDTSAHCDEGLPHAGVPHHGAALADPTVDSPKMGGPVAKILNFIANCWKLSYSLIEL